MLHQRIENYWWHSRRRPNALLRALAAIYAVLMRLDQRQRARRAVTPPIPMISVGNITVGGSGKTPFVIWLAAELKKQGRNPVLLSRGDGANNQEPHLVTEYSRAREVGDEAVLLNRLSGCPVIAGRDRVAGARLAADHGDIVILDDGFQYRQLDRICDIVLVPKEGVGSGCLLPAGPLREPLSALARADLVVRSGSGDFTPLSGQREWSWSAKPALVRDWMRQDIVLLEATKPVHLVTGIARPGRVLHDLQGLGFEVAEFSRFADHHEYSVQDVALLLQTHKSVVTTAKDAVKLLPLWPPESPLWVLEQQAVAEDGLIEAITAAIRGETPL
ncbi:lipid-A-disaccharide kinase [Mariprofundus ferrinatatus]|uniref:Tetraacyldisaccharide 4'-kinase n=1 Tax=Mariprofundus ferrinatatus TaxID=1921087 RepID=A0A2K8L7R6_9PROT|nr:tetraacyldisaccharide 4'-kinase [Mariprofundus ferrinatatus]ATX81911.1 lipid-A-disaccharide kinase [Mariprofundus ferrinatatus]